MTTRPLHPLLKILRFLFKWSLLAIFLQLLGILAINLWMTARSQSKIYDTAADVPAHSIGLVLGTSRLTNGRENAHFNIRIKAAAELYKAGKVSHFLLSGDNSSKYYNEPEDMKNALMQTGVPASAMTMDYAGLRTFDSVVRAKEVFDVHRCVIISDDFHLARALWLAERRGIDAVAYYSGSVGNTQPREWLARIGAVLDEYVLETRPKHGGDKVSLPVPQLP